METPRELARAMDAGLDPIEVYGLEEVLSDEPAVERAVAGGAEPIAVTSAVLQKLSYRENPRGFVAVMQAKARGLSDLAMEADACVIVCSGLEKPGNLGAILRSADALGAGAVLIDRPDYDLYNPNALRASTGAVFTVPVVGDHTDALIAWLKDNGFKVCAATPDAEVAVGAVDVTGRIAWVLGSEAEGLGGEWLEAADTAVTIPMRGQTTDSLNVSVSAALLLYETDRQRRGV